MNVFSELLVTNLSGSTLTTWWNSGLLQAHHIDFTKTAAQERFYNSLESIRQQHGIDSYKFDAGEFNWAPEIAELNASASASPYSLTTAYVDTCVKFGDMIEIRTGYK